MSSQGFNAGEGPFPYASAAAREAIERSQNQVATEVPREEKLAKAFQRYLDADKDYIAAVEYLSKLALEEQATVKKRAEAMKRVIQTRDELHKLMISEEVPSVVNDGKLQKGWKPAGGGIIPG